MPSAAPLLTGPIARRLYHRSQGKKIICPAEASPPFLGGESGSPSPTRMSHRQTLDAIGHRRSRVRSHGDYSEKCGTPVQISVNLSISNVSPSHGGLSTSQASLLERETRSPRGPAPIRHGQSAGPSRSPPRGRSEGAVPEGLD